MMKEPALRTQGPVHKKVYFPHIGKYRARAESDVQAAAKSVKANAVGLLYGVYTASLALLMIWRCDEGKVVTLWGNCSQPWPKQRFPKQETNQECSRALRMVSSHTCSYSCERECSAMKPKTRS
jgi:hypothetical protein